MRQVAASVTTATGPVRTDQVATLYNSGTTPSSIKVTYRLTNQQYAPIGSTPTPVGQIEGMASTGYGMNFGASGNYSSNTSLTSEGTNIPINTPNGVSSAQYKYCSTCATTFDPSANYGASFYLSADALISNNTASGVPGTNKKALNATVYYGDLMVIFNTLVMNPVFHISGLGDEVHYTDGTMHVQVMTIHLELQDPTNKYTLTKLAGSTYFSATSDVITNTAPRFGTSQSSTGMTVSGESPSYTRYAAGGSVQVSGAAVDTLIFKVYLKGDGGNPTTNNYWSYDASPYGTTAGDRLMMGVSLINPTATISGRVVDDGNGGIVDTVAGVPSKVPSGMYANLLDSVGNVVATTSIDTKGYYSFSNVFMGKYTISISPSAGTVGSPAPATTAPNGWVNTGEYIGPLGTGTDPTVNGKSTTITVTATTTSVTNVNFGIDAKSTSENKTKSYETPAGTDKVVVPTLTGTDREDSTYSGTSLTDDIYIATVPSTGTLYYNGSPVTAGTTITNYDPSKLTYDPPTYGTYTFTYSHIDVAGVKSTPATVTMIFNDVPVALNDTITVTEDVPYSGTVATNDTLSNDGGNTFSVVTSPNHGTITMASDGSYTYTPDPDYNGNDTVQYKICDANGDCDTAYLFININPVADTPIAVNDTFTIDEDDTLNSTVVTNDTCVDGGCTFSKVSDPANGTVTVNTDGTFTYVPDPDFNGTDTFVYNICSGTVCDTAVVYININPINDPPESDTLSYHYSGEPFVGVPISLASVPLSGLDAEDQPTRGSWSGGDLVITSLPTNGFALIYNGDTLSASDTIRNYDPSLLYIVATSASPAGTDITVFEYALLDSDGLVDATPAPYTVTFGVLLPVEIMEWAVNPSACDNTLSWRVVGAKDFKQFEIEKMALGDQDFKTVTILPFDGVRKYTYTDYNLEAKTTLYRMKLVDMDGTYTYTTVLKAHNNCDVATISLWPNPADHSINLDRLQAGQQVNLIAKDGRIVLQHNVLTDGQLRLSISQLPTGDYLVQVMQDGQQVQVIKFVKLD